MTSEKTDGAVAGAALPSHTMGGMPPLGERLSGGLSRSLTVVVNNNPRKTILRTSNKKLINYVTADKIFPNFTLRLLGA